MFATIDQAANPAGVIFGNARSAENGNSATSTISQRTIERTPSMCSGSGFSQYPPSTNSIFYRRVDMLIRMIIHFLCLLFTETYQLSIRPAKAEPNHFFIIHTITRTNSLQTTQKNRQASNIYRNISQLCISCSDQTYFPRNAPFNNRASNISGTVPSEA